MGRRMRIGIEWRKKMKHVEAVLWRNFNKATYDTLAGNSKGQYDIRLGSTVDLNSFFYSHCFLSMLFFFLTNSNIL